MDPEAFFSQLFGGDKFLPFIGQISLGSDMKTALQEDNEETTTGNDGVQRPKSKKEMTPEERQRKEEKEKKEAAEVRDLVFTCQVVCLPYMLESGRPRRQS